MSDLLSNIRNSHDKIYKVFLAALTISAIVLIFPKEAKFKYEFQKNKPWKHEQLLSPFQFSIQKSDEAIELEQQEIRASAKPHFKVKESIRTAVFADFEEEFINQWPDSKLSKGSGGVFNRIFGGEKQEDDKDALLTINQQLGKDILNALYRRGVISLDETIEEKSPDFSLVLTQDNILEDLELGEVFTVVQADAFIHKRLRTATRNAEAATQLDTNLLQSVLSDIIEPNIFYDLETSQRILDARLEGISESYGSVETGENIIGRGDIVSDELYQKLVSLKQKYETQTGGSSNFYIILAGQFILAASVVIVLMFYLSLFRADLLQENRNVIFILVMLVLMVALARIANSFDNLHIYALPFCILPVIVRIFYDVRIAIFLHTITVVLVGFMAPNGFEFVFLQVVAGIIAVFSLVSLRKRSQLLSIIGIIFGTYSITYLGFAIIQEGEFESINWMNFAWFGSGAVLTLFAFPMVFIFEKTFGFISDVTLMELSDTNSPLLRELASKAPGTFQHTIQVSNLAEAAALEIGGDPLLIRTGSLYHDIGKMERPQFFIENQVSGVNPHDDLPYEESARIIIDHVINGIALAKKHKLPEDIIDFIRTHHGTSKTMYFLNRYKLDNPGEEVDEKKFQYPGPVPYSKETAILMMADSVEAASRSLKEHNAETIGKLVDNIIDGQADHGQFLNANITFQNLSQIKKIFKKMLMNIYHVRIEYPK